MGQRSLSAALGRGRAVVKPEKRGDAGGETMRRPALARSRVSARPTLLMRLARPALRSVAFPYFRLTRGMTLGVRGVVIDDRGGVLLVRHTYVPGWHFPGGGVDGGESLRGALARELHEEAGVSLSAPATLHGVFRNAHASSRDHVAVFIVRGFTRDLSHPSDREIAEARVFAAHSLPEDVTSGTAARLREVLSGAPAAEDW